MKKVLSGLILMMMIGCAQENPSSMNVEMFNAAGDSLGTVELEEKTEGVSFKVNLKGLEEGAHGFHVHEKGSCEGPDFKSAGDHFNPDDKEHGLLNAEGAHAGDLPNIEADGDGKVSAEFTAQNITLKEGKTSLLKKDGTALVVHAKPDDGMSLPAGDAGERVACGEIKKSE